MRYCRRLSVIARRRIPAAVGGCLWEEPAVPPRQSLFIYIWVWISLELICVVVRRSDNFQLLTTQISRCGESIHFYLMERHRKESYDP